MTDKEFEKAMRKCGKAYSDYLSSLSVIEEEYRNRYGHDPAEISDDFWIDSFCTPPGSTDVTVKELEEKSSLYWKRHIH